jgi:hypothetical protein
MCLQEVEWEGMDWIDLAQDWDRWWALVNVGMNLWVRDEGMYLFCWFL